MIPFVLALSTSCLAEKQQTPFFFFGLTRPGTERTIYHILLEHAYHDTTDALGIEHA